MRNQSNIFLPLVVMSVSLSPQEVPTSPTPAPIGQVMGERDKAKEDQVAKSFETIRADAKLPPLGRIRHRSSLEQQVCTLALTGATPKQKLIRTFALYKTLHPESVSTQLSQVASFTGLHPKDNPTFSRYSIAVWRKNDSETGESMYWVGAELYWSAAAEFFDYHFTDDLYNRNAWKKSVAAQCRSK